MCIYSFLYQEQVPITYKVMEKRYKHTIITTIQWKKEFGDFAPQLTGIFT